MKISLKKKRRIQEIKSLLNFTSSDDILANRLLDNIDHYVELCRKGKGRDWLGSISNDRCDYHLKHIEKYEEFKSILGPASQKYTELAS